MTYLWVHTTRTPFLSAMKISTKRLLDSYITVLLFLFFSTLFGQTPLYKSFLPEEYGAAPQNFSITQDDRGVLYFGNTDGVLVYNGVEWNLIETNSIVRSVAYGNDGMVYVGTVNDIGMLVPDKKGQFVFESIRHRIPEADREFRDVWRIRVIGDQVFFSTFDHLYLLENNEIKSFAPQANYFGLAFDVGDDLYQQEHGKGLYKYDDGELHFMEGTELFSDPRIYTIFPYGEDKLLLGSKKFGLSLYSLTLKKIIPFSNDRFDDVISFLIENKTYSGTQLRNGNYVFGTILGGFIIVSKDGVILGTYNRENGIKNECIYMLEEDHNGLLWASLDNGICQLNYDAPFSLFSSLNDFKGVVFSLENHNGVLYVGTNNTSYKVEADNTFKKIQGADRQNWFLKSANNRLLLAHNPRGFLTVTDDKVEEIKGNKEMVGVVLCDIKDEPNLLLGAAHEGLFILEFLDDDQWVVRNAISGFDKTIYTASIDQDGDVWVRCAPNDLYHIRLDHDLTRVVSYDKVEIRHEGEVIQSLIPYQLNDNQVVFGSDNGAFHFSRERGAFERFPPLKNLHGDISPIYEDSKGNIWYEESRERRHHKGVFMFQNGQWQQYDKPFRKFLNTEIYKGPTKTILELDDGKIAFATLNGLLVFDPKKSLSGMRRFNADIANVYINDTLHFASNRGINNYSRSLSYDENSLRFDFASYNYEDHERTKYRYRLLGQDSVWSNYAKESNKEYSNLKEGKYTFELESMNQYLDRSEIASYSFQISPPWYRTILAYVLYGLSLVAFIYTSVTISSKRLAKKNRELELLIKERTEELENEKNKSDLLSKNLLRIFAIIGHDMKRHVMAFKGITEKVNYLLRKKDFVRLEKFGKSIEDEALALNQLTNNLLNWALVKRGGLPHNPQRFHLQPLVQELASIYGSIAKRKEIKLQVDVDEQHQVFCDRNALSTIIRNLLDNAIKYTEDEGEISMRGICPE